MTGLTQNGISTTTEKNSFRYETMKMFGKIRTQWDYRDSSGKLHSGIAKDLETAKIRASKYGYQN